MPLARTRHPRLFANRRQCVGYLCFVTALFTCLEAARAGDHNFPLGMSAKHRGELLSKIQDSFLWHHSASQQDHGLLWPAISVWPAGPFRAVATFFGSLVLLINPVEEAVADVVADADHRRHGAQ